MLSISFRAVLVRLLLALAALVALQAPAGAHVSVTFHSYSGSFLTGRYPHAFVSFDGTLDDTGEAIHTNYGFSAVTAGPEVLAGPVKASIFTEKDRYVRNANRHFTIEVPDATYRRMVAEMIAWRDAPGKFYDLNHRNCIHFVGAIAVLAGLRVDFPHEMLRKPKAWLNHIGDLNPQLGAHHIS
jgi:hypothetical protein